MRRRIVLALGFPAAAAVMTLCILFWRDALELWHMSRLDSRDLVVRESAADALRGLRSVRAVPVFLCSEPAERARPFEAHARQILAALDDDGYERLASRLAVEAPELTVLAFEAAKAAEAPRRRLLPLIRRGFRSPDAAFRRWACEAAGDAGRDAALLLPQMRDLLKDADRLVRLWARIAEAKLDPETPAIELVGAEGRR